MPSWFEGKPFAITVAVLFIVVVVRAQGTYWLGRGVTAGVLRNRFAARIAGPRTTKAVSALNRWGLPLVTLSFLTIGFQTVVNAAAGLARMPWMRYTVAMLIGCVAWAMIVATVGMAAVQASLALAADSPWALVAVLAAGVTVVITIIAVRRRRSGRDATTLTTPQPDSGWPEPTDADGSGVQGAPTGWSEPPVPGR